jgi:hypothetical protein
MLAMPETDKIGFRSAAAIVFFPALYEGVSLAQ